MKPRTIMRGKWITQYFLIILLLAMVFNIVSGAIQLSMDANATHGWYWAIIAVVCIYAIPLAIVALAFIFFRSKARRVKRRD